jgi:hypothetical protein
MLLVVTTAGLGLHCPQCRLCFQGKSKPKKIEIAAVASPE